MSHTAAAHAQPGQSQFLGPTPPQQRCTHAPGPSEDEEAAVGALRTGERKSLGPTSHPEPPHGCEALFQNGRLPTRPPPKMAAASYGPPSPSRAQRGRHESPRRHALFSGVQD